MKHSKIEEYRLPNETDLSWSLRKEFIERYQGDFPEVTLLSLAKVYSDTESGVSSNPVCAAPTELVPEHEELEKSQGSCKKEATCFSTKKKHRTPENSRRPHVKMKQKSLDASGCSSGASSQKRKSHKAFQANLQRQGDESCEFPVKKSRRSDLKSPEGSNKHHSIMSKGNNDDVTLTDKPHPKNQPMQTSACDEMSKSDAMDKARDIALQYSLGEKVLEIDTWPENLKNNFVSILQFVRKSFSKELSTSEILHSLCKRFKLRLQYRTKEFHPAQNCSSVYKCFLKVDSVVLGRGCGSTLKKARIAAGKEVIDKLMKLSREVGNLSSSYFKKNGNHVEHSSEANIFDGSMNENENAEHVHKFAPDDAEEPQSPCNDISAPCQNGLSQRLNVQCDGRQRSKCSTIPGDLGSDVARERDGAANVDSRSLNCSVAGCDAASVGNVNTNPLESNSFGDGVQQKLCMDQSIAEEAKSDAFKKVIRFSNGFCIAFGFDKNNQLMDVSGHDSSAPRSEVVQNSAEEINKKLSFEVVDVESSDLCKLDRGGDGSVVIRERDSRLESISRTKQNSTEGSREKSLTTKIVSNQFPDASNAGTLLDNISKSLILQERGPLSKRKAGSLQNSHLGTGQTSTVQEAAAEVHPQEMRSNSKFNRELGAVLNMVRSTVPAQNAFDTANCNASDSSQMNSIGLAGNNAFLENCTSGPVDPRTSKMFNGNNRVGLNINGPINLLNAGSNGSASNKITFSQKRTNIHNDKIQKSADFPLAESVRIFSLAFQHIERLISRRVDAMAMLHDVSQTFSANIKYDYTRMPVAGLECLLTMDGVPICKAYGLSAKEACFAACQLAVYKLVELAAKVGIISFSHFDHLVTWYNSGVSADRSLPIEGLSHSAADPRMKGLVATSQIVSPTSFENPEHNLGPTQQINVRTPENSSWEICARFVAILDYSDFAESESYHCVLHLAAELNRVKLKFFYEDVEIPAGLNAVRVTIRCNGNDLSTATGKTRHTALENASQLALSKLKKTAYIIKMKYEHFDGFIVRHDQVCEANHTKTSRAKSSNCEMEYSYKLKVKQVIEEHKRKNSYSDLLFCTFNKKERAVISKIAAESHCKAYGISGKCNQPKNLVVSRYFTASDLVKHLMETKDKSCKLRYELIPPPK